MAEILDITVILLLVVAILYGFRLNSKINLIRDSRKELSKLFKSFDNTILKAQEGIDELRKASEEASSGLQQKIDRASLLIDDLSFVSEKAIKVSTQVLQAIDEARKLPAATMTASTPSPVRPSGSLSPEEVVKLRERNKAHKTVAARQSSGARRVDTSRPAKQPKKDKTMALEEILTQIAQKNDSDISNDNRTKGTSTAPSEKQMPSVTQALKALGYGKQVTK